MQIKRYSESHPVGAALILVLLASLLRLLDYFVVRTDELIGEQVLTKVGGFILVAAYAWIVKGNLTCIGFHGRRWKPAVALGLLFMAAGLAAGYFGEWLYLRLAGEGPSLLLAMQSHPLVPEETTTGGLVLAIILVVGNVVNSCMEEGLFRGVLITHLGARTSPLKANLLQALLFGVWHIVVPIRAYLDGQMELGGAIVMSVGYIILSGLIGFVWGTFYQKTGSLWAPWVAHWLNNTTQNFLQITTIAGPAATMALRNVVIVVVVTALLPLFHRAARRMDAPQVEAWV